MKKIINTTEGLMKDMLHGYAAAHSNLIKIEEDKFVVRTTPKEQGKVGVVVANGSGHEPCMIGLVGTGLLDVNIAGNVFAAPSGEEVCEGIRRADHGAGVIVLVSSHAGDIMNARVGVSLARKAGITCEMAVLWDDIFSAPPDEPEERRGTAGLFFVWKIVGAAAEQGASLAECVRLAEKSRDNVRALTVAIEAGTHPQTGKKMFELPQDEIEVGMGVHGEAGTGRMKLCTAKELVSYMVGNIIEDKPFQAGDRVCVLLNNCGAMTYMELYIIYGEICDYLHDRGIEVVRNWIGAYATTQEMAGFGIGIICVDDELLQNYDYPADTILRF